MLCCTHDEPVGGEPHALLLLVALLPLLSLLVTLFAQLRRGAAGGAGRPMNRCQWLAGGAAQCWEAGRLKERSGQACSCTRAQTLSHTPYFSHKARLAQPARPPCSPLRSRGRPSGRPGPPLSPPRSLPARAGRAGGTGGRTRSTPAARPAPCATAGTARRGAGVGAGAGSPCCRRRASACWEVLGQAEGMAGGWQLHSLHAAWEAGVAVGGQAGPGRAS